MNLHLLLLLIVAISALRYPVRSYENLLYSRNFLKSPHRRKSSHNLFLSRSKSDLNPYRIVKNDIPIVYTAVPESSVLLSVDLGLRSGFAFYNSSAHLIGFTDFRFDSLLTLKESIRTELNKLSERYDITHFVLEGDTIYGGIWRAAIDDYAITKNIIVTIIDVSPLEWRKRILSEKERKSGRDAKCAAREISRQIMWRSGMDNYQLPMNTDVAEAILIGHYAVHDKLKWNERPETIETVLTTKDVGQIGTIENIETARTTDGLIVRTESIGTAETTEKMERTGTVDVIERRGVRGLFLAPLIERYSNGNVVLPAKRQL